MSCFYLPDECDEITAVTVLYFIVTDTLYCKCRLIIYFKEHIVSNFVKNNFNENLISILLHKIKKNNSGKNWLLFYNFKKPGKIYAI